LLPYLHDELPKEILAKQNYISIFEITIYNITKIKDFTTWTNQHIDNKYLTPFTKSSLYSFLEKETLLMFIPQDKPKRRRKKTKPTIKEINNDNVTTDESDASSEISDSSNELITLSSDISDSSNELITLSSDISDSSSDISDSSSEISDNSNEISDSSSEISDNSNEISDSSNEIINSSSEISDTSNETSDIIQIIDVKPLTSERFSYSFNKKYEFVNKLKIIEMLKLYYESSDKFKQLFKEYDHINIVKPIHNNNNYIDDSHFNIVLVNTKTKKMSLTLHANTNKYLTRIIKITTINIF
jgi:hypothetical protein